jgi:Rrf2 family protein
MDHAAYVRDISDAENIPVAPLAKIFQMLAHHGILASTRGRKGGFLVAMPLERITLGKIVEAIEGPLVLENCPFMEERCGRKKNCLIYESWTDAIRAMSQVLFAVTIRDLVDKQNGIPKQTDIDTEPRVGGE